jgi:hypothetical protein
MSSTTPTNIFQEIEAKLESEAAAAVAWFKGGNANFAALLTKVASGAEVFVEDIETVGQWFAAHLTLINSLVSGLSTVAAVLPSSEAASAQKMISDLQTAANDVAAVSTSLASGTAGQPGAVTTAVTALNAVNQLSQLATAAAQSLGTSAINSPSATTTATVSSPAAT